MKGNKIEPLTSMSKVNIMGEAGLTINEDFMREHSFRSIDDEIEDDGGKPNIYTTGNNELEPTQINLVEETKIDLTVAAILNERDEDDENYQQNLAGKQAEDEIFGESDEE
jgi:hypothetical protein